MGLHAMISSFHSISQIAIKENVGIGKQLWVGFCTEESRDYDVCRMIA